MTEAAARAAIDAFFEGFNGEDDVRMRASLNFPHVRLASGSVRVIDDPEQFNTPFDALKRTEGWHHSRLERAEVIHAGADKVHFDVRFSRFQADGSCYATHQAVWVVTRVDGHWGIQARSSFAP